MDSESQIISFLKQYFPSAIQDSDRIELKLLAGEIDQTFLVLLNGKRRFVTKISSTPRDKLQLQCQVLLHLAQRLASKPKSTWKFPVPVPCADGRFVLDFGGGDRCIHVLHYTEGKLWSAITRKTDPKLLVSLGEVVGWVDHSLCAFDATQVANKWAFRKWDLPTGDWIESHLNLFNNLRNRFPFVKPELVHKALHVFKSQTKPMLSNLTHRLIYNDANDNNILVKNQQVVSLIDFGDLGMAPRICDLAIAIAYAAIKSSNPLRAAYWIVRGFVSTCGPLMPEEVSVLPNLVQMRLSISVTCSAQNRLEFPKKEYLFVSEEDAWKCLDRWDAINDHFAVATLRYAAGLAAVANCARIEQWINTESAHPILEESVMKNGYTTLDMSMGSPLFAQPNDWMDLDRFGKKCAAHLMDANGAIGIGRYNEPRCIYYDDRYKRETEEGSEWRTVHLGIDLFADAGVKILAPFLSEVVSVVDNDAPLDYGPTVILKHRILPPENNEIPFYTLYGHLDPEVLDRLQPGQKLLPGEVVALIGQPDRNGGWPPHLHFQVITALINDSGDFPGVAFPEEIDVWKQFSPDPTRFTGLCGEGFVESITTFEDFRHQTEKILMERSASLAANLSLSYSPTPLYIVRGFMQYLFDIAGRTYLDAVNNVPNVGHSHPSVSLALQQQSNLLTTNTRYLHPNITKLAKELKATLPESFEVCFFVNSGTEANELAIRLANTYTQRKGAVVLDAGYHGNSNATIDISPYKHDAPGGRGAPQWVRKLPIPDCLRGLYSGEKASALYAAFANAAIADLKAAGYEISFFIAESILGCGGQIVLPPDYLSNVYEIVRSAGGLCIADEVQVGFGRVGSHYWAFQTQGVVPDIITLGKPFGNGHPLGAVVTTRKIADAFHNGMEYFNTFGGNPVSCAVGLAVMNVIKDENLQHNALEVGSYFLDRLTETVQSKFCDIVADVRGLGLYIGIELAKRTDGRHWQPCAREAAHVAARMKELGVLISTDGPDHNVLKIKPPLCFSKKDVDFVLDRLVQVLLELGDFIDD